MVTVIGVIAGLGGALALARLMASLVFQTSPLDARVMAGSVLFMAIVAAAAAWLPARWATHTDPREVLQS
jgi:ABC-type antimicrobial peptide transport system permease subunit